MILPALNPQAVMAFAVSVASEAFGREAVTRVFSNPFGATMNMSDVQRGSRTTVSAPGDTPDTYGPNTAEGPLPTDGVVRDEQWQIENGASLTDVSEPSIWDKFAAWAASVVPRAGVFILGGVLIVLALYMLTRPATPGATPVVIVEPKRKGKGGGASSPTSGGRHIITNVKG